MERMSPILKDMLRMYVMEKPTKWEDYVHLLELSCNNEYQTSLKIITFYVIYGKI